MEEEKNIKKCNSTGDTQFYQENKYILWSPVAYNTTGSKPHHANHRPNSKWHKTAGAQTAKVWQEYSGLEEAPAIGESAAITTDPLSAKRG